MPNASLVAKQPHALGDMVQLPKQLTALPPFNGSAIRLLSLTSNIEQSFSEIEEIFRCDPVLTADLLLAANSAAFALRSRVSSIRQALAFLGLDRIRSLAIMVSASSYLRGQLPPKKAKPIWMHGVATGVIAEYLTNYSDGESGPLLYALGLLHDIGRLGLLASSKEAYGTFLETEFSNVEESQEVEHQLVKITHNDAGELLLRTWGFPPAFSNCSLTHHTNCEGDKAEDRIIRTACVLAHSMGYPEIHLHTPPQCTSADKWRDAVADGSVRNMIGEKIQSYLR